MAAKIALSMQITRRHKDTVVYKSSRLTERKGLNLHLNSSYCGTPFLSFKRRSSLQKWSAIS